MKQVTAIGLFVITIATVAVTWRQEFWATALAEVPVFILAAVWLIAYLANAAKLQTSFVLLPLIGAVLWPLLQLVVGATVYRWATSVAILYWAANAAVVFIGVQLFSDPGIRRWYLRALVIAGLVIGIAAPLQKFTAEGKIFWLFPTRYPGTVMGPFVYENHYAAFIELLLPIALTSVFSERSSWRTLHGLSAVVMYASVLATSSRTGFALTSLEVLIVPVLAARRAGIEWRRLSVSAAIFLAMLSVLGTAAGPEGLFTRLGQKNPFGGRREYLESSLRMIADKPLMGVGMGNWSVAYPAYATFDEGYFANEAHNDWAQWAAESGVPFDLLMLSIACWSFPRALRTGWGAGVAVIFLQCLVDFPVQPMGVAIVFFSLLAALASPLSGSAPGEFATEGIPQKRNSGFSLRLPMS